MSPITALDIQEFTKGYIQGALWCSTDDYGKPFDKMGFIYDIDDIRLDSLERMKQDCIKFLDVDGIKDMIGNQSMRRSGLYFWRTRNNFFLEHGTWEGGGCLDHARQKLTELCQSFGTCSLCVGDDHMIHAL